MRWRVVGVVSAGGVLGSLARYALSLLFPHSDGAMPWATFAVNVSGCLLIGVVAVLAGEVWTQPLVRPFLGAGVLGGYTTFSAYAVDAVLLVDAGRPWLALAYVAGTLGAALVAVWSGTIVTRRIIHGPPEPRTETEL